MAVADRREVGAEHRLRPAGPAQEVVHRGAQCFGGYAAVPRNTLGNFSAMATASSTHGQPVCESTKRTVRK